MSSVPVTAGGRSSYNDNMSTFHRSKGEMVISGVSQGSTNPANDRMLARATLLAAASAECAQLGRTCGFPTDAGPQVVSRPGSRGKEGGRGKPRAAPRAPNVAFLLWAHSERPSPPRGRLCSVLPSLPRGAGNNMLPLVKTWVFVRIF